MAISIGRITSSSDSGTVQKVQVQSPLEIRSDTPRLAEFGFSSGLPVGTDVVVACLGGDRSSGVIIASNHQQYRQAGLNPGETIIYSQWGQFVKLTETGITIDAANQSVDITNATTATVTASESVVAKTPLLKCTGDIIDNCESNTKSLKDLREAYNQHTHQLKDVQGGDSTLTSEMPSTLVEKVREVPDE
ncbi:baseplate assembly protein [Salmonella enterica subsp. enterica serovar Alachua]|nr:baseplate assembly protein [Salmonella enterica subsp. enterica serovar Alachua]